ncbi:hypothetical protein [Methylomonas koyamae]|nr:hypothetical protein [Methylomonas koyamae]
MSDSAQAAWPSGSNAPKTIIAAVFVIVLVNVCIPDFSVFKRY